MKPGIDQLLAPVPGDLPAGVDLDATGELFELETLAKPKAVAQNYSSDPNAAPPPPEEPDWPAVLERAAELLGKSKDLRVGAILALSLVKTAGLAGLRDGLALIAGLTANFWEGAYPKLDADDGDDPMERINAINNLAAPLGTFGDHLQFLLAIRQATAVKSRQLGPLPVGSFLAAKSGGPPLPGLPALEAAVAEGLLREASPDDLTRNASLLAEALASVQAIEATFQAKAARGQTPGLGLLRKELTAVAALFGSKPNTAPAGAAAAALSPGASEAPHAAAPASAPAAVSGEIRSRDDVVQALDRICLYYERYEPASPLPFLLRRARRLVGRNFLEVMSDLAPDALTQIRVVTGAEETEKAS